MTRDTAILLAPHAARFHSLLPAGQTAHALLVCALLVAVCVAAAVAVRWSGPGERQGRRDEAPRRRSGRAGHGDRREAPRPRNPRQPHLGQRPPRIPGGRVRVGAGRQAVLLGRDRPDLLRLLRPGHGGVRRVSIPRTTFSGVGGLAARASHPAARAIWSSRRARRHAVEPGSCRHRASAAAGSIQAYRHRLPDHPSRRSAASLPAPAGSSAMRARGVRDGGGVPPGRGMSALPPWSSPAG